MTKRKIVLIGIIALIIIILVAGGIFIYKKSQVHAPFSLQGVSQAIKSGSVSNCPQFAGQVVSGTDYEAVCEESINYNNALQNTDMSGCSNLNGNLAIQCQTQVALKQVSASKNLATCNSVPSSAQNQCVEAYWAQQSIIQKNVGLCSNSPDQNSCQVQFFAAGLFANPSGFVCNQFPTSTQNDCTIFKNVFAGNAATSTKLAQCGTIVDVHLRGMCGARLISSSKTKTTIAQ